MPYTLVSKAPEQEPEESLTEYFNRFEDYLLLDSLCQEHCEHSGQPKPY